MVNNLLYFAPLFILPFGYWQLTNNNIFSNSHLLKNYSYELEVSKGWYQSPFNKDILGALPLLIVTVIIILIEIIRLIMYGKDCIRDYLDEEED